MKQYHDLLKHIIEYGEEKTDRTGVGTKSVFGYQMRFNLERGFPAVTTKKLAWKSVVSELLWFLEGSDDERRLVELLTCKPREECKDKNTIWTANANKQGMELGYTNNDYNKFLGPIYGVQWRNWNGVDQIAELLHNIKNNPNDRRHIVTAWNTSDISKMALPPCHCFFQFYVSNDKKLSCQLYQRSADVFLGVPFNIASYSLLVHIIARECNLGVGEFIHTIGDCHIYLNHFDQVNELLLREPYDLPTLKIHDDFELSSIIKNKMNFKLNTIEYFNLLNYKHHSQIKAEMAV